jgi:hypothetical protein
MFSSEGLSVPLRPGTGSSRPGERERDVLETVLSGAKRDVSWCRVKMNWGDIGVSGGLWAGPFSLPR